MAAMIRPIGVDHPQFCDGRVTVFLIPEIVPAEFQVGQCHGKAHAVIIFFHLVFVPGNKARYPGHVGGHVGLHIQRFRFLQGSDPGFHRVDQIMLDPGKFLVRDGTLESHYPGGEHLGALSLGQQLYALGRRVRPLVVLAGQIFHGKHPVPFVHRQGFLKDPVHIGFRQDGVPGL